MATSLKRNRFADDYKNTYTFDDMNRLISILQEDQSGGNAVADKLVKYVSIQSCSIEQYGESAEFVSVR